MSAVVAIRVDASIEMGLGHLRRCVSLADCIVECGAHVVFVTRKLDVNVAEQLKESGRDCIELSAPAAPQDSTKRQRLEEAWSGVSWDEDARETVQVLASRQPSWVIVDHYSFDQRWHKHVAVQLRARLAVIDDLADKPIQADVVIDHNLSRNPAKHADSAGNTTKLLAGPRFGLLGRSYRHARRYEYAERVSSIGIFMGGVDQANWSSRILSACREVCCFEVSIEIATTSANPNLNDLRRIVARSPQTTMTIDLPDLAHFFSRHDIQIGAGGGAALERAAIGVPSMLLAVAENQVPGIRGIIDAGGAVLLSENGAPTIEEIGSSISSLCENSGLRKRLAAQSRLLVDGRGAQRVALFLLKNTMVLHPVKLEDADVLYQWRNHQSTRSVSRSTLELDPQLHTSWVADVIRDEKRLLLLGKVGNTSIGVIRLDGVDQAAAEVSLYLDPGLHGVGLGRRLLLLAEEYVRSSHADLKCIVAHVRPDNLNSLRLFESCGYICRHNVWEKMIVPMGEVT